MFAAATTHERWAALSYLGTVIGMISGIHHLGLTVRDVNASAAWYERVLGFRRTDHYGPQTMLVTRCSFATTDSACGSD